MRESEITLAVMVLLLVLIAWMQEREIRRLRLAAQESDAWADRWEELAAQAAEEAEQVAKRHARLQALYTNLVRAQMANSWIVVRKRDTER